MKKIINFKYATVFVSLLLCGFAFSARAGVLENLTAEITALETRAQTLESDITRAGNNPQVTVEVKEKLTADLIAIRSRVGEIKNLLLSAPSAPSLQANASAVCESPIELSYTAPVKGTVLTYELNRNPDANQSPSWGAIARRADLASLPPRDVSLKPETTYQYQLHGIGLGGLDAYSNPPVQVVSPKTCPPAITANYSQGNISLAFTLGLNKTDYAPGETMIVTGSGSSSFGFNNATANTLIMSGPSGVVTIRGTNIVYPGAANYVFAGHFFQNCSSNCAALHGYGQPNYNGTINITAPTIPGNYTLKEENWQFPGGILNYFLSPTIYDYRGYLLGSQRLSFTVTEPTATISVPVSFDYSLSKPSNVTVTAGQNGSKVVKTTLVKGSAKTVTLTPTVQGPAGAIHPTRITPASSAVTPTGGGVNTAFIFITQADTTPGNYIVTVTGAGAPSLATPMITSVSSPRAEEQFLSGACSPGGISGPSCAGRRSMGYRCVADVSWSPAPSTQHHFALDGVVGAAVSDTIRNFILNNITYPDLFLFSSVGAVLQSPMAYSYDPGVGRTSAFLFASSASDEDIRNFTEMFPPTWEETEDLFNSPGRWPVESSMYSYSISPNYVSVTGASSPANCGTVTIKPVPPELLADFNNALNSSTVPVHSTTFTITVTAPPKPDFAPLGAKGAEPGPNAPVADRVNPDGTYIIGGDISFKVQPKNIGADTTKSFNLKLQKKFHDNPAVSPRHPDSEYVDTGDIMIISGGLSGGVSVDRLITYTVLVSDTDQSGYDFRYCIDAENNVLESNENNNCSGPLSPPVVFNNQARISSLAVSCSVSPNAVDLAVPNQIVTWTAVPSGGTEPYSYLWAGNDQTLAGKTTKDVTFTYDPAVTERNYKFGRVKITDFSTPPVSKMADCMNGISVSNSNDGFGLVVGPLAIINFVGQSAVSNRVFIMVDARRFNSPVTVSASGLVGGIPVEYIFYKHGTSDKMTAIAPGDYETGLDMVIKAVKFIPEGSYPNAVKVHGEGVGKSDDKWVRVDVNDSRPKFQEF